MAFGTNEIVIIVVVIVLLFGAAAIPKLARSLGRAQGEFKRAKHDFESEMKAGEADSGPSEAQIRKTAEDLGIETDGKSVDELKAELNAKLG